MSEHLPVNSGKLTGSMGRWHWWGSYAPEGVALWLWLGYGEWSHARSAILEAAFPVSVTLNPQELQVGIYALDGLSKKHGMLTSKVADGKVLTYKLQRWKTAKKNHGRKTICYASLLTQIYTQTMTMHPTPTGINHMETNQFYQPETFRLNCVEVWLYCWWMIYSK